MTNDNLYVLIVVLFTFFGVFGILDGIWKLGVQDRLDRLEKRSGKN